MKKLFTLLLILAMVFTFAACGGGSGNPDSNGGNQTQNNGDSGEAPNTPDNGEQEFESFSVEAAEYFFSQAAGLQLSDVEPEWEWELKSKYMAYGDSPTGSGHAVITFTKKAGELQDGEYDAWLSKVFAATAKASQDGYNIIGYEFAGEGEDARSETTLDAALDGFLQGWAFRCNDRIMVVYVSDDYDSDKDSELGKLLYYDGVKLDIGYGMEMDWNDYEDLIEDNQDLLEDALGG